MRRMSFAGTISKSARSLRIAVSGDPSALPGSVGTTAGVVIGGRESARIAEAEAKLTMPPPGGPEKVGMKMGTVVPTVPGEQQQH